MEGGLGKLRFDLWAEFWAKSFECLEVAGGDDPVGRVSGVGAGFVVKLLGNVISHGGSGIEDLDVGAGDVFDEWTQKWIVGATKDEHVSSGFDQWECFFFDNRAGTWAVEFATLNKFDKVRARSGDDIYSLGVGGEELVKFFTC